MSSPQESSPQESSSQESSPQESSPQMSSPQESSPQESSPQMSSPQNNDLNEQVKIAQYIDAYNDAVLLFDEVHKLYGANLYSDEAQQALSVTGNLIKETQMKLSIDQMDFANIIRNNQ